MRRVLITTMLLALAIPLSGCVVAPGPHPAGWCYYHPYACR